MSKANDKQVGGNHYASEIQHWDWAISNDLSYLQGQITKYVARYKKKHGIEDLRKAQHCLEKLIETEEQKLFDEKQHCLNFKSDGTPELGSEPQAHGYVDQD
tara:strand:+ start:175 stop:480 length:306 start_codon:yes stop_codon:yes gene_type:complete